MNKYKDKKHIYIIYIYISQNDSALKICQIY